MRYRLDIFDLTANRSERIIGVLSTPEPRGHADALVRILTAFPEAWTQRALAGHKLQFNLTDTTDTTDTTEPIEAARW